MKRMNLIVILAALAFHGCGDGSKDRIDSSELDSHNRSDISVSEHQVRLAEDSEQPVFDFPAPQDLSSLRRKTLWATYYYVPEVTGLITGPHALLDTRGRALGPKMTARDWCSAAMEGTVRVVGENGVASTFNYAGIGNSAQVDCSPYFRHRGSHFVRFKKTNAEFGEGAGGYKLVPYRSLAVSGAIRLGTVLYIPAARGVVVKLPNGETVKHDGYFFAADVGGLIQGNHIDVFLGISKRNPFAFVRSSEFATFGAYEVKDAAIKAALQAAHSFSR